MNYLPPIYLKKFKALDEYLSYLSALQAVNKKNFLTDYHQYGAAERYLHLSIQVLMDVAKMMIADYQFPLPEEPRDIFRILFTQKAIDESLYGKLTGMVGFRNILVHEYADIDRKKVYDNLQNNLDQFVDFKRQVLRFLKKKRA